jgi:hypothetical protein
MTVSSPTVKLSVSANLSTGAAPAPSSSVVNQGITGSPTVGSAAFNVNKVISKAFTITTGTPYSIDLNASTDPFGVAVSMTKVTDIILTNLSTTAGQDMTLGSSVSNSFMGAMPVDAVAQPTLSGICLRGIEKTVDATHKVLEITVAAGTAVAGQITVLGR